MPQTKKRPSHIVLRGPTAICATAVLALVALSGCGSGSGGMGASTSDTNATSPKATTATVRLQNIAIKPSKVTIQRGSTVTWQWLDGHIDTAHNVTSLPGGPQFKASGTRQTGSYTVRFNTPGKYLYECTIHPASMQGEIVVE